MFYTYCVKLFFQEIAITGGKINLIRTKKIAALFGFFCFSLVNPIIFAQDQPMVRIYIAPMESGSPEEQEYFMTNMKMEFAGASYEVVDVLENSDYNLTLSVSQQEPVPESESESEPADGEGEAPQTEVKDSPPPVNTLSLDLVDTKTGRELIALSWDYQQLSEMDMWNLYLITQAMSNAPIIKMPAGAALSAHETRSINDPQSKLFWFGLEASMGYTHPGDGPYVSGLLSAEYDFLPFMGVNMGFGYQALSPLIVDIDNKSYYHTMQHNFFAPLLLKFFLNVGSYLVVPYAGAEFNFGTLGLLSNDQLIEETDRIWYIPAVTTGVDFRLSAGPGVLDIGSRGIYDFNVNAWAVEFVLGYKFGFYARAKKE
jgi:hypothetical protein